MVDEAREAEVLKWLEHLPVLIVNGSMDMLVGLERGKVEL